ncbi:MAG TPA: hypothetical protein VJR02_24630 [Pyrinomonadaceae bacterium]|nr:hypothetical protein [Pyrinomonadaceae bacterium]
MNLISRKQFVALSIILLATLVVFLVNKRSRVNASEETVVPGSLEALAQNCAANGIQSVDINTMLWEYDGIGGIDDALSKYSVVVAHPVSSTSYTWSSELQIVGTWYKFAVTESLSQRPHIPCDACDSDPPASLLPLSAGHLLIPKYGGSVMINGVTINSIDTDFPAYQTSQSYLLFLNIDQTKGVGNVDGGGVAVYAIGANGVLTPINSINSALAEDISLRYGNSLTALRTALGGSVPTPSTGLHL